MPTFPITFPANFATIAEVAESNRVPPPFRGQGHVVSPRQIISLRTITGIQLYQFLASDQMSLVWGRESREVSRCELSVKSVLDQGKLPDIIPWEHWIDVWDEDGVELYWSGPIEQCATNRQETKISARDTAALFTRTRCPLTKRWDATDPAEIAEELAAGMIEHHGLNVKAMTRPDPLGDRFDFSTAKDDVMVSEVIDQLVDMGLHWTVVSGTPLFGPLSRKSIASLGEHDFIGEGLTVVRDGTESFNDILLRGADNLSHAKVPMGRLSLQTIVDIESMFGVSNVDRAVKQYARYAASIKDTVSIPAGAVLHPDAPVSIEQLIPSARMVVDAYGLLVPVELIRVEVNNSADTAAVAVTLVGVDDELPELIEVQQKGTQSGLGL